MKDALDAQKTAHVFFELDQAAPKLGQLAEYLKHTCMTNSDLPRAAGFVEHLRTLMTELTRMMNNVEGDKSSVDVTTVEPHPTNTSKSSNIPFGSMGPPY